MTNDNIRLCEPTSTLDAEILRLYEGAFPAAERESVERLSELLSKGKQLCHRTLNDKGELLCFTIVTLGEDFNFLAYMATDPTRRSSGIGSKHLARLLERLKQTYPQHYGMFFEIEATRPKAEVLSEEDARNRMRRRAFYERAGARVICPDGLYLTPHYNDRNKEWEGELMGFEFDDPVAKHELQSVIEQIYMLCYQLPPTHPMVRKVIASFAPCFGPEADTVPEGDIVPEGDKTDKDANTDNGSTPDETKEENMEDDNCGCEARGKILKDLLSRIWARIRALLGL
ncbi:MAG TPA: hypothetical protein V6D22_03940 [Candidatus Obscuribacterales bacterium]